jgi:hypothetical protein
VPPPPAKAAIGRIFTVVAAGATVVVEPVVVLGASVTVVLAGATVVVTGAVVVATVTNDDLAPPLHDVATSVIATSPAADREITFRDFLAWFRETAEHAPALNPLHPDITAI